MTDEEIRAAALSAAAYLDNLAPEGVLIAAQMYERWIKTGEMPKPDKPKMKVVK